MTKQFLSGEQAGILVQAIADRLDEVASAAGSAKPANNLIPITYSELVSLRNSSKLYPGATYRITDYKCSSSDVDTAVASYEFDILVKAIDTNKLSEHCGAMRNASDTYFPTETDFDAWEVWYCLDNDTTRFGWASASGKGVIYRLIDEFGNDCPYDFKNIMFKRSAEWFSKHKDWCNSVLGEVPTNEMRYFTFSILNPFLGGEDLSINYYEGQKYLKFYQNKIAPWYVDDVQQLNKNAFILPSIDDDGCHSNTFENYCYSNTFGNSCYSNTFGNYCYSNTFGNICYSNTFENNCYSNTFGDGCHSNTFGNSCCSNTFGNYCRSNTFGNSCYSNIFRNYCYSNTFENYCYSNTFGDYCYSNTFGNYCYYNTFENNCDSNTFGNNCRSNTFGNNCNYNFFKNSCSSNKFGSYCKYNTFGNDCGGNIFGSSDSALRSYYRYNCFEDGVQRIIFYTTQTTSSTVFLQNITIHRGVKSSQNSTRLTISVTEVNKNYNREYGRNIADTLVNWVANAGLTN